MTTLTASIRNKPYYKYAEGVLDGSITAGVYIKKAAERFFSFFDRYEFRPKKVDRVIDFVSHLKHYQGKHKGQPFELEPWQTFAVANIFGWYDPQTGYRVTQSVYLEMARKQGKSALIAAIALYCLTADGESGAEVDCIANSVKQSHILFDMSKAFSHNIDPKRKHFTELRDTIKYPKTNSFMQVLASDSSNLDGFNPSCFILDEVHEYKDSSLYDVMVSGQGMRENPLGILITTAGFDMTGFCYIHRQMCIDILYNLKQDDTQFSLIYELDRKDEWDDPKVWMKANPNLGVTVTEKFLAKEVERAKNQPTLQVSVKTKNLCIWVPAGVDTWIADSIITENSRDVSWDELAVGNVTGGIDLASTDDLSSVAFMCKNPDDNKFYFKVLYYLPEVSLQTSVNAELYKNWYREGYLILTPGNVTDYDYILRDILQCQKAGLLISQVGYDTYNATQFTVNATQEGVNMIPFPQALYSFNRPTREFERLMLSGRVVLDNNPITRWCFNNATLKVDHNNNVKPIKKGDIKKSPAKIDGCITTVEALGTFLNSDEASW